MQIALSARCNRVAVEATMTKNKKQQQNSVLLEQFLW